MWLVRAYMKRGFGPELNDNRTFHAAISDMVRSQCLRCTTHKRPERALLHDKAGSRAMVTSTKFLTEA